ncbi:MAG: hypothetical protein CVU07_12365, partial [Bacteroidetes bacterium HGW-Bacteroidetes-23]
MATDYNFEQIFTDVAFENLSIRYKEFEQCTFRNCDFTQCDFAGV